MSDFANIFLALLFEATPFLLAGVVISVVAGPLVERVLATAALRNPAAAVAAGASAGLVLPMCDCGNRPLAHRLALAGRREFALAFLVAAPVINPIVIVTTWLAFRSAELVILRLLLTVLAAVAVAIVVSRLRRDIALPLEAAPGEPGGEGHAASGPGTWAPRILEEFFELFQFLVVGAALAAAIQVFADQEEFLSARGVFLSIAAMMFLAFLLSICSSVDAFVVAGLGGAIGLGPALGFLVFGPLVNLKSIPMYLRLFSGPAVVLLVVICAQVAFAGAAIAELRAW
ncbi:permease [Tepidiforma flava]|uniref:Permease n=1 Tax=Tepidiforma flava TaxID=3004094 RepID=A0ABY7MCD5_9CHLR|nr:permease [Tepidiforma flava]WBL37453.1 permease [Tepidiforma flava]